MSVTIGKGTQPITVTVTVQPPTTNVTVPVTVQTGITTKKPLKRSNLTADGTEQTIIEATGLGLLEGYIDLSNMNGGDTIILKQYVKVEEGGNYKLYESESYSGVQSKPMLHFQSRMLNLGMKITLQQTAGVFRAFPHEFFKED